MAFQRADMLYVEDLLGTSPRGMVLAQGPEPPFGPENKYKVDTWLKYRYKEPWREIRRISDKSILQTIEAIASWREMNRLH